MRSHEIENWALDVLDRIRNKQPIEDSRVELKATWPDPKKAARRIAGHANAARGEPILWIIGADEEKGTVPGVDFIEFASWYSSVSSVFDELAPEPISINIPSGGVTVTGIYFETDRAPFVVKNTEGGGTIQREVPWREATAVKSATRSQLLRLLSAVQKIPNIEPIGALLRATHWANQERETFISWSVSVALFLTHPEEKQTVISGHRCALKFWASGFPSVGPISGLTFRGEAENVNATQHSVSIRGSGVFEVRHSFSLAYPLMQWSPSEEPGDAHIELSLQAANLEHPIVVTTDLRSTRENETEARWELGDYPFRM